MQVPKSSLKVKHNDEIRRFSVPSAMNHENLVSFVANQFSLPKERVVLKYIDDEGELITVGSDLELSEARRLQPELLRLTLTETSTTPEQPTKTATYKAVVLRDITLERGASVPCGSTFDKVWLVRNTGDVEWKDLLIKPASSENVFGNVCGKQSKLVAVGERIHVSLALCAPGAAGTYSAKWRLVDPEGNPFGQELCVEIVAVDTEHERKRAEEAAKRAEEELQAIKMAEQLQREEEEKLRKIEEEKKRLEAEKKKREEEEMLRKMEEEKKRLEEEKKKREEEELRRKIEEEMKKLEEEKKREEEELRREMEEEKKRFEEEKLKQEREQQERKRKEQEKWEADARASGHYDALVNLREMGFTDMTRNIALLKQHNGNINEVIETLFA